MMTKSKTMWEGTIVFPGADTEVSGKLYSAAGRETRYEIEKIHVCTKVPQEEHGKKKARKKEREDEKVVVTESTPIVKQAHCPTCNRDLRPEEIGQCIVTPKGARYQLTDERDINRLTFEKTAIVEATPVHESDHALSIFGTDTRYYFVSNPESKKNYWVLFEALDREKLVGFIPLIVIGGRPKVAVLRPVSVDATMFDDDNDAGYRLIFVVECMRDSDDVRDPAELSGFHEPITGELASSTEVSDMRHKLVETQGNIDPRTCLNPRASRLRSIVRSIRARTGAPHH